MPFSPLKKTALLLAITSLMITVSHADTSESHTSANIDPNAPIVALDKLQSLKTPSTLNATIPKIEHFTTANGTPVAFVETHNLPMVDVDIRFNAGSARDEGIKPGGFGLANLTADTLNLGTKDKNEEKIAELTERLGVNLNANAYKDMFVVNLRSLSDPKYRDPAVNLMQEIISQPSFPTDKVERTKQQILVSLRQAQESPEALASEAFYKELYGSHPYAHASNGTLTTVPTLTPTDLKKFQQKYLVAHNASIAITGDVRLAEAKQIADTLTKNLPTGTPAPALPDAKPLTQAKTIHLPFNSTQTAVLIGEIGDKRANDEQTLQKQVNFALGNEIVGGGGFQARLMADVRKKRGLTYGIYSGMTPMLSQGSHVISFSTRNEKTAEALQATQAVLKDTLQNGITQNELDLTKDHLINGFPLSFSSNASLNNTLGMMNFYHLPDSYLSGYVQRVKNATLAEVNQSLRDHIAPDKLLTVTVGGGKEK